MTKLDFIAELRTRLKGLPEREVEDRLAFYGEMIDDRVEDGCSEEEAVFAALCISDAYESDSAQAENEAMDEIAEQIIADIPMTKIAKDRIKPKRRLRAWEIVLLAVGSPLWLTLGLAAAAVILSVYAVLWSVIVSLWAVFGALAGCAIGGVAAGIILICFGNVIAGIALIGAGLALAGVGIFAFMGCKAATKGIILLTKMTVLGIKKCFIRREEQ